MRWEFLKFEECFFIVNGLLYMLLNGCFVFIWYILLFLVIGVFRNDGMYYVEVKWLFGGVYGRLFMMGRCFLDFGNFYFVVKRFFGRVFGRFYKLGK